MSKQEKTEIPKAEQITQLFKSIDEGKLDEVQRAFKRNKALVGLVDDLGRTPLMWACLCGRVAIVKYLLDNGADPNIQDKNGLGSAFMIIDCRMEFCSLCCEVLIQ